MQADEFWLALESATFSNEASVETILVAPLLSVLGYSPTDVAPKFPVVFSQGKTGRPHEADFVVFNGPSHTPATSLIVIEAKGPRELIRSEAKRQAESYAQWLRAPLYLLTNGVDLEIWQMQPSSESQLVFRQSVRHLGAHRAVLESLLSKRSIVHLFSKLKLKDLASAAIDVSPYLEVEANRLVLPSLPIKRRLLPPRKTDQKDGFVDSLDLLTRYPKGFVVLGRAGIGKTTLQRQLAIQQVHNFVTSVSGHGLPFSIYLPDLVALNQTIISHAQDRLAAHCPTLVGSASFSALIRERGALLLLDGFDRIPAQSHGARFLAELAALRRDHPRLQIVLFSRPSADPGFAELPVLQLDALNLSEQYQLAKSISDASRRAFHRLPPFWLSVGRVPYMLERALDHLVKYDHVPKTLPTIFNDWLNALLTRDKPDFRSLAERETLVNSIALRTADQPLSVSALRDILRALDIRSEAVDYLTRSDLLSCSNGRVELSHEILADFIRARSYATLATPESLVRVPRFAGDSALPIFLSAFAITRKRQDDFWTSAAACDLHTYLATVEYSSDFPADEELTTEQHENDFLRDFLEAFETLRERYFPGVASLILDEATHALGDPSDKLSIVGAMWPNRCGVIYSFERVPRTQARTVTTLPRPCVEEFSTTRRTTRIMPNLAGRRFGALCFRDTIIQAVDERRFPGGVIWAQERARSHLEQIFFSADSSIPPDAVVDAHLAALIESFEPLRGEWLDTYYSNRIHAADLLHDLELLTRAEPSHETLRDFLTGANGHADAFHFWDDDFSENECVARVGDNFRRAVLAYREVIERGFAQVADLLVHYPQMPLQYKIRAHFSRRDYPTIYITTMPVRHWSEMTVSCEIVSEPPSGAVLRAEADDMLRALSLLGRPADRARGYCTMRFSETGFRGERFVVEEVSSWLDDDVRYLFSELVTEAFTRSRPTATLRPTQRC